MQKNFTTMIVLAGTLFLSACVTNYQYASRGELEMTDGETRSAVLYWHGDEGRLWYGKKYEQLDSSATLRVCEGLPKNFSLGEESFVFLPSKAGDERVARVAADGELEPLADSERLPDGESCGVIQADGMKVGTDGLPVDTRPTVTILCRNAMRPDRYPLVSQFVFSAVTRNETDEQRSAPDPCVAVD